MLEYVRRFHLHAIGTWPIERPAHRGFLASHPRDAPLARAAAAMAELHPMLLRSLKRTHDMYLSNYGQRPADNEQSLSLRIACKTKVEYGLVKDMPAAPAANSAAAAGAQKSGTEVAAAPAPLMLQDKGAAAKPAGGPASKAASSAVVAHVGTGGTHIMPRRRACLPPSPWNPIRQAAAALASGPCPPYT